MSGPGDFGVERDADAAVPTSDVADVESFAARYVANIGCPCGSSIWVDDKFRGPRSPKHIAAHAHFITAVARHMASRASVTPPKADPALKEALFDAICDATGLDPNVMVDDATVGVLRVLADRGLIAREGRE